MSGLAIITEACIDVKDRACVDVCPVQCIDEFDLEKGALFSEVEAGSGVTENTHQPNPAAMRSSKTASCMWTSMSARRVPRVISPTCVRSERSTPKSVSPTQARRRTTTPRIRTRVTTTPSSSSTVGKSLPTSRTGHSMFVDEPDFFGERITNFSAVTASDRGDGSEGWGFESLRARRTPRNAQTRPGTAVTFPAIRPVTRSSSVRATRSCSRTPPGPERLARICVPFNPTTLPS